jgi:hypothetical protein
MFAKRDELNKISEVVNLPDMVSKYAGFFTAIGVIIAVVGLIGCIGVCRQATLFQVLVSTLNALRW